METKLQSPVQTSLLLPTCIFNCQRDMMSNSHLVLYMFKSEVNFPLQASSPSSLETTIPFLLVVKSKNLGNLFFFFLPPLPWFQFDHTFFLMICHVPSPGYPNSILLQLLLILPPKSTSNVTTSFPSLASTFFQASIISSSNITLTF